MIYGKTMVQLKLSLADYLLVNDRNPKGRIGLQAKGEAVQIKSFVVPLAAN